VWIRSSFCTESGCLEAVRWGDLVLMRNSTEPNMAPLAFTQSMWRSFLAGVRIEEHAWKWWRSQDDIEWTPDEAAAFRAGVLAGEFDFNGLIRVEGH